MSAIWPTSLIESSGSVEGRLLSVSTDGLCTLIVEDRLSGRPVVGYLGEGMCPAARALVGRDVVVRGRVQREAESGIAVALRDVAAVGAVAEPVQGDYRAAAGILKRLDGGKMPEDLIRELRGGSS